VRWWVLLAATLTATACSGGGGPVAGPANPLAPGRPIQIPAHEAHQAATGSHADAATVDVVSGATTVTVRAGDLGRDRIRALTPAGAAVAPVLDAGGDTVTVHLVSTGESGPAAVTVLLDRRVRWQVRMSGGATDELLDLRGARLSGVDLAAGATRIELRLPAPDRAVLIRMAGGASELTVHVPAGVATGVRVGGGAGSAEVDGIRRTGLAGGTVLSTATDPDRYDVDATAGVSTLVLDRG
jgi:hypothetical protein